jgi:hypothetical protein
LRRGIHVASGHPVPGRIEVRPVAPS